MTPPPEPLPPTPSLRQLAWHELEYYCFIHFNMNTFTGREWGEGYEDPAQFNPTQLDCRQWARVCSEAGMKGIILTAKHHDGFCLWQSDSTEHSVKNSPFRGGKGDVLRELSTACREFDLKLGFYLSPWDRNHPNYGTPAYNEYFKMQLKEVLTGYGEIFEFWFDGANGEGPNGKRQDYDWEGFIQTVREHQPKAALFSDAGPDIRWVGNENGFADETNWSLLHRDEFYPGTPRHKELTQGHSNGTHWVPAECDVSIRPGWFYHSEEDDKVKSPAQLMDIYERSVGRNGALLLNLPVDRRGLVHENDIAALLGFKAIRESIFAIDLAKDASITASNVRGGDPSYAASLMKDDDAKTFWATDDEVNQANAEVDFGESRTISRVLLQEFIPLGQRVEEFAIFAYAGAGDDDENAWKKIVDGTTIGNKRILSFPPVLASKVRLEILKSRACPVLKRISIY